MTTDVVWTGKLIGGVSQVDTGETNISSLSTSSVN